MSSCWLATWTRAETRRSVLHGDRSGVTRTRAQSRPRQERRKEREKRRGHIKTEVEKAK